MATKNRRCNIVIDSCCDLPRELVDAFGVEVLEFPFIMDDGEHLDDLGKSLPAHEFYSRMRKGEEPKTAQIPYHAIAVTFDRIVESGVPTVLLCFSSGLSGTYETIHRVWEETRRDHPEVEIHVVDTLLASVAEGALVLEAIRQRDRGLTASELAVWVEEARYYVNAYFTLGDLEALHRGGRIPDMAAAAGAKLDIKPILTFDLDGRLALHSIARGRKKSIKQMLQLFKDNAPTAQAASVIVASADAEKELSSFEESLMRLDNPPVIISSNVGPVIGSHVGPDMMAVVFWGPDRREGISITDRIANAVSERSEAFRSMLTKDEEKK